MSKRPRENTVSAERASLLPFARFAVPRCSYKLALTLPPDHLLVNCGTFRQLQWGRDGHREIIRSGALSIAPLVVGASAEGLEIMELERLAVEGAGLRDEWESLPYVVPRIEAREGHVYVTSESNEQINVGSELYCRIVVGEGVVPKQVAKEAYERQLVARKESERAGRDERKLYGECAPLGVRLKTVRTQSNGDCFFDAIAKAFGAAEVRRNPVMWAEAFPTDSMPASDEPPTIVELRAIVASHYSEQQWLIAQQIGGAPPQPSGS